MTGEWYSEGLRFRCLRCGACCTGDPGYVFLADEEIRAMAEFLEMEKSSFMRKYARKVGRRISLREERDGRCVFFHEKCSVYQVRPYQCRAFPFWASNLTRKRNWEGMKAECPGMGRGRLFTEEEIRRILAAKRR